MFQKIIPGGGGGGGGVANAPPPPPACPSLRRPCTIGRLLVTRLASMQTRQYVDVIGFKDILYDSGCMGSGVIVLINNQPEAFVADDVSDRKYAMHASSCPHGALLLWVNVLLTCLMSACNVRSSWLQQHGNNQRFLR